MRNCGGDVLAECAGSAAKGSPSSGSRPSTLPLGSEGEGVRVPTVRLLGRKRIRCRSTAPVAGTALTRPAREGAGLAKRARYPSVKMKVAKAFGKSRPRTLRGWRLCARRWGDDVEIFVDAKHQGTTAEAGHPSRSALNSSTSDGSRSPVWQRYQGLAEISCAKPIPSPQASMSTSRTAPRPDIAIVAADIVQAAEGRVGGVKAWDEGGATWRTVSNCPQVAPHAVQLA